MDAQTFAHDLQQQGFDSAVRVEREAGYFWDTHSHPFEARALILAGDITLSWAGQQRCFRRGEVFHLAAHEAHNERAGPDGVVYLAGRKSPTPDA